MKKVTKSILMFTTAGVMALSPCPVGALTQNETVYVKLQPNGATDYISVIEHLKNDLSEAELFDETILENLENLNGFEGFTVDGKNVKWDAQGKDIFYRGTTNKELPVQLQVTYKLNGEEKALDELLGQAGQVEITLNYTNLSKVDDLYTPFVVAVATKFDAEKVSNVTVTNGKVVTNGRTTAITAIAAPGLYESLGLEELKGSNEVIISFETDEFELSDIYSVVTPELLNATELKTFAELDELYAKTNQLASGSQQLVNGSASLTQGLRQFREAILGTKNKLTSQKTLLDNATLGQIKSSASTAAMQSIQAQSSTIQQEAMANLRNNTELIQLLMPAARDMCLANPTTAGLCDNPDVLQQYLDGILTQFGATLSASSVALAQRVATQTANTVAESVATEVANSLQQGLTQAMVGVLDEMLQGVDKLLAGAYELQTGAQRFNNDGIQPLVDFVNGKVRVTTDKVQRLIEIAEQYDNYAGLADQAQGTIKFVLMIEEKHKK